MDAIYQLQDFVAHPSPLAAGPWSAELQSGAAPAALAIYVAEAIEAPQPMRISRFTLDLFKPVPIAPVEVRHRVIRQGRKIQLCEIDLVVDDLLVAKATVLKVRSNVITDPSAVFEEYPDVASPDQCRTAAELADSANPFLDGVSVRVASGGFRQPGPAAVWFRADRTIIAGQPTSPAMRAAIAADFCNGVSAVVDYSHWTYLNADITLSLARAPVGEWILLQAETWLGPDGIGIASGRLADVNGYFGRAIETLVVERREQASPT